MSIMMYHACILPCDESLSSLTFVQNLDLLEPHNLIPNGVWTLDGLLRYGEDHKQCPYFTARRMVSLAGQSRSCSQIS